MNKVWKKLSVLLVALCLVACGGALTACGGGSEDNGSGYSVTVMQDATTPAVGVQVTVGKGSAKFDTKTTGNDGKVTFALADDEYEITLTKLPAGFDIPADANLKLNALNRNLTVTLAEQFHYTVKLVLSDGSPFPANLGEGVMVAVCDMTGNCRSPVFLDTATATAKIYQPQDDYHVQLQGLPDGWTYDKDAHNYYTGGQFLANSDNTELTITIYPTPVVQTAQAHTTLKKYADQERSHLEGVPLTGSPVVWHNGDDGFYHLQMGNAPAQSDPVVVVRLTSANPTERFENENFALIYGEPYTSNQTRYVFDVTPEADKDDPYKAKQYIDYRPLLRGFADYKITISSNSSGREPIYTQPDIAPNQEYYAKYVNSDGVYPLNTELRDFLQRFYAANSHLVNWNVLGATNGNHWLFPCYYYVEDNA